MASNSGVDDAVAGALNAVGTKRSHSNRESTSQTDEDMAQIRKRVIDANNALRASGLAWSSGAEGVEPEDGEHDEVEEDEDDAQNEEEDDDDDDEEYTESEGGEDDEENDALPPSPIPATSTHVWMLLVEEGDHHHNTPYGVHGLFKHFNDALRVAVSVIRNLGMGEGQDEDMEFEGPKGLRELAHQHGHDYYWEFGADEGEYVNVQLKWTAIL